MGKKIKCGVIGVGNCFAGLVQGIEYYRRHPERAIIGIMREKIGPYTIHDIEFVSAFDVAKSKVGKKLSDAVYAKPNLVKWVDSVPESEVIVKSAPILDGVGAYVKDLVKPISPRPKDQLREEILSELEESGTEVLISYLPVGSQKATEFWADIAIEAGCAFVNCIPVFIASNKKWRKKFESAGLPVIGDDIKGQVGATIVHRVLAKLFSDRNVELESTYQLNVGGNTDFKNMLERSRLVSKEVSKTNSVQSQLPDPLPKSNIHIGPSDYVEFLRNTKIAFIRLNGCQWADRKMSIDLKLEVDDKANSGAVAADAIRLAKLSLDREVSGAVNPACAYLMKSPPVQMSDDEALRELDSFIKGNNA